MLKEFIFDFAHGNMIVHAHAENIFEIECQLDGKRFQSKAQFYEHVRNHHIVDIENVLNFLLSDMDQDHLGNFFTKLFYSDMLYPSVVESTEEADFNFPSVVAPELKDSSTGKTKKKKDKDAVAARKRKIDDILSEKDLLKLELKIYGAPPSSQESTTSSRNATNSPKKPTPNQPSKTPVILDEDEETRRKREAAIIAEAKSAKKKNKNKKQQPTSSVKNEDIRRLRMQIEEELTADLISEVVMQLCTKLATRSIKNEKKVVAKQREEEAIRKKREAELARVEELQRKRKRKRELTKRRREFRKKESNRICTELCNDVVTKECESIVKEIVREFKRERELIKRTTKKVAPPSPRDSQPSPNTTTTTPTNVTTTVSTPHISPELLPDAAQILSQRHHIPQAQHVIPNWGEMAAENKKKKNEDLTEHISDPAQTTATTQATHKNPWSKSADDVLTPPKQIETDTTASLTPQQKAKPPPQQQPSEQLPDLHPFLPKKLFRDPASLGAAVGPKQSAPAPSHSDWGAPLIGDGRPNRATDSLLFRYPSNQPQSTPSIFSATFPSGSSQTLFGVSPESASDTQTEEDEGDDSNETTDEKTEDASQPSNEEAILSPIKHAIEQENDYGFVKLQNGVVYKRMYSVPEEWNMKTPLSVVCYGLPPDYANTTEISGFFNKEGCTVAMVQALRGEDCGCFFVQFTREEYVSAALKLNEETLDGHVVSVSLPLGVQITENGQMFAFVAQCRNITEKILERFSPRNAVHNNNGKEGGTVLNPVAPEFRPSSKISRRSQILHPSIPRPNSIAPLLASPSQQGISYLPSRVASPQRPGVIGSPSRLGVKINPNFYDPTDVGFGDSDAFSY